MPISHWHGGRFLSRKSSILLVLLGLQGCVGVPVIVTSASTAVSTGIWIKTGKSTTDHTLDYITKDDCVILRVFQNNRICQDMVYKQEQIFEQRRLQ